MNGGFCQLPSGFCGPRHTHHLSRAVSGANASADFSKFRLNVVGFASLRIIAVPSLGWPSGGCGLNHSQPPSLFRSYSLFHVGTLIADGSLSPYGTLSAWLARHA